MQFANVHWISHHGDLPHEHRQNYCRQSQLYFIHLRMIPQSDSFRITLQPVLSLRWFLHLFSALRRGLQVGRLQFWSRLWCWLTVSFWSRFISVSTFSLLWIMLFPYLCDSSREQNKAWSISGQTLEVKELNPTELAPPVLVPVKELFCTLETTTAQITDLFQTTPAGSCIF